MTLAARLAARRRFDRLSRRQLEQLVASLTEKRRQLETDVRLLLAVIDTEREHVEQRLLGRAFAHEADARHRDTGLDRAKWHQAVADELRDAARDIGRRN